MKIGIVGAGAVGGQTAFALALKKYRDIALVDIAPGLAEGKAMDIMQSEPVWGFPGKVAGGSDYSLLEGSSVVVITAGSPRREGMSRDDLFKVNYSVMESVCESIKEYAPGALIIVVSNPLDLISYAVRKLSGFDSSRVMGMGGVLDSARYRYFISRFTGCAPDEAEGMVIGPHGAGMIPLSEAFSAGKSVEKAFGKRTAEKIKEHTGAAGKQIVSLLKDGSAFFAPASAISKMIDAISKDKGEILPVSVMASGVWGLPPVYIGLPAKIGRTGVKEVVEKEISNKDLNLLRAAADNIYQRLGELGLAGDEN